MEHYHSDLNLVTLPQLIAKEGVRCLWLGRPCDWVNLKMSVSKGQKGQWSLRDNKQALVQVETVDICVVNTNTKKHSMHEPVRFRSGRPGLWVSPCNIPPYRFTFCLWRIMNLPLDIVSQGYYVRYPIFPRAMVLARDLHSFFKGKL